MNLPATNAEPSPIVPPTGRLRAAAGVDVWLQEEAGARRDLAAARASAHSAPEAREAGATATRGGAPGR